MIGGQVEARRTDEGVVGFAGLFTCGAVWLCPVCNSKIMAKRAIEIGLMLAWAQRHGLRVIWGSLTCRHTAASALRPLILMQREAWRAVVSAGFWRKSNATVRVDHTEHTARCAWVCAFESDEHTVHNDSCEWHCERKYETHLKVDQANRPVPGRVGYVRAAEITIGGNGWHPHFHPLILFRGTVEEAELYAAAVVDEWVVGVEAAGGEAIRDGGQQLKVLQGVDVFEALTGYVTKATFEAAKGLALETVWSQGKSGRGRAKETRSHWSLLVDIEQGLADEAQRWLELETATAGHRMITWSRGLRDIAGVGTEDTDEDLAAREVGGKTDAVCIITARGWMVVKDAPEALAQMLDALELGWDAMRRVLEFYGVEYTTPEESQSMDDSANANYAADKRNAEYRASARGKKTMGKE